MTYTQSRRNGGMVALRVAKRDRKVAFLQSLTHGSGWNCAT